ncbi:MAG: hypothetical protein K2P20_01995, partial [Oscillospiraceae bacterium]|nr:hypothetical protein [Oscillospiraceae bacterium]
VRANLAAVFQQPLGGLFHLLDSDQFHSRNVESAGNRAFFAPFSTIISGRCALSHFSQWQ